MHSHVASAAVWFPVGLYLERMAMCSGTTILTSRSHPLGNYKAVTVFCFLNLSIFKDYFILG